MLNVFKKYALIIMFALISLGATNGIAFAYSTQITLDGREDAGLYPGQTAFLKLVSNGTDYPGPATDPGWTHYSPDALASSVSTYAYIAGITGAWSLESAGNVWSSSDKIVGEGLTGLSAGTYRISKVSGDFIYSFVDNPDYYKYWWRMNIQNGSEYLVLGSQDGYTSAAAALSATTTYLDLTVPEGGSISFWIWDNNSIDNSGSITFNVESVPEPSTFLLLTIGLAFLIRRTRS